jgi:hypothetical protein
MFEPREVYNPNKIRRLVSTQDYDQVSGISQLNN